jgi:acyl-CoA synthetase (AMP-forming)/AMP-acid ligase II
MRNGQKTLPSTLENALHGHPLVLGAVVFGHGQDHIGVLIELRSAKPAYSQDEQTELRSRFWYAVSFTLITWRGRL